MRNSQPLDVPVDCGGNFRQTGTQDSLPKIATFGWLFDALLPVCSISSFVCGEFEWERGLFGSCCKENLIRRFIRPWRIPLSGLQG